MTAANTQRQQPKEYIITAGDLDCIEQMLGRKSALVQAIRSRPHPAPQAPEPMLQDGDDPEEICKRKPICAHYPCGMEKADSYCGMKLRLTDVVSKEHDAAIERKAREQVLKEFQEFSDKETQTKGFHSGWILGMALDQKIESLRHHSEQQEQPR